MKPPPFDYVAPENLADALNLMAESDREAKILAGGQSLLPVLNMRMGHPELLVDITRVPDLAQISITAKGELRIGAGVRQADAARHPAVVEGWPLLAEAISWIGHPQIRNSGTVCGSLAHHDSAAELPAIAVLLDAVMEVHSVSGVREVPAADFFVGTFTTDLAPEEILVAVRFPALPAGTGWSVQEFAPRRGDFATVGAACVLQRAEGAIRAPRVCFFGVAGAPVLSTALARELDGRAPTPDVLARAAEVVQAELDPPTDAHASREFRLELAAHLFTRTIETAWERCA